jgi:radical SAM protein (TIGR04043 family)
MTSIGMEGAATSIALLKTELLALGLRVDEAAHDLVTEHGKPIHRVRSGSCGGLDVILPGDVYVNCPINEAFARESPLILQEREGRVVIGREGEEDVPIRLVPCPEYYHRTGSNGKPLARTGQLCGDRLGIGLTNNCFYWRSRERRCTFCSIGLNLKYENRDKRCDEIVEVTEAALSDPVAPARHILLGGGTPDGPDAGAIRIAEAARAIKERWDCPIYAMIVPPDDNAYIDLLKESGVDELGMNLELWDQDVAAEIIPGKKDLIGLEGYRRALEHAVRVFGPINTRSIMVVGLEAPESTVQGVAWLASLGVMPILSPFRPMTGTELEDHPRPSVETLWQVCVEATEAAGRYDMPIGPVCIPCQENTLNVPGHPAYRYY